jgi:toxin ParE1/3/4
MRRGRLRRTARAEADLIEIWQHIAAENEAAADRIVDRLDRKSRLVASFPNLGRRRDDLAPGLRQTSSGNYLILYRQIQGGAEVVRYVHGARQLSSVFDDG